MKAIPTRHLGRAVGWAVLGLGWLFIAFPLAWTFLTAFKPQAEISALPPTILPNAATFENFALVFERQQFGRYLLNSVIVTVASTAISVPLSALAGYGFAKFAFPFKNVAFVAVLILLMVPFQILLVPLFRMVAGLHWLNSYQGLMIPFFASAIGVLIMRNAAEQVPDDYIQAGRIDGASHLRIFWSIALPMMRSSVVAVAIVKAIWTWNEFLWPLVMTQQQEMKVVTLGLREFSNMYFNEYHLITAAALMSLLPLVVVFLLLQRSITRGLTMSGLK